MSNGIVFLVGAGPGDPGLITVKGLEALRSADVVVYDALANARLLREARPDAELISVGKRGGCHTMKQEEINALLVAKGKEGKRVCRLKGGDPFVGIAAPACAGIPVTHRGLASSVAFVTGHEDPTKEASDLDWGKLATAFGTLAVYMGVKNLPSIVERLVANGLSPDTPAAVVQWGTSPRQRTATGRGGCRRECRGGRGLPQTSGPSPSRCGCRRTRRPGCRWARRGCRPRRRR